MVIQMKDFDVYFPVIVLFILCYLSPWIKRQVINARLNFCDILIPLELPFKFLFIYVPIVENWVNE